MTYYKSKSFYIYHLHERRCYMWTLCQGIQSQTEEKVRIAQHVDKELRQICDILYKPED